MSEGEGLSKQEVLAEAIKVFKYEAMVMHGAFPDGAAGDRLVATQYVVALILDELGISMGDFIKETTRAAAGIKDP